MPSSPTPAPVGVSDLVNGALRAAGVTDPVAVVVSGVDGDALDPGPSIHLAVAEGQGDDALASAVAAGARPWVCAFPMDDGGAGPVLAALLAAGYVPAYHDGALVYLVAGERRAALLPLVDPRRDTATQARLKELEHALATWRERALSAWAVTAADLPTTGRSRDTVARELHAMKHSLSWRVTVPLRVARPLLGRVVRAVRR